MHLDMLYECRGNIMRLRDTPFQPSRINTTTANITNPTTQHLHIQTPPLASLHPPHSLRLRPPIHIRHTQHHPGHPTNLRHPIRPVPRLTHLPNNIPPNRRVKEKPVPPANQPPPPTTPSPNHTQEGRKTHLSSPTPPPHHHCNRNPTHAVCPRRSKMYWHRTSAWGIAVPSTPGWHTLHVPPPVLTGIRWRW